MFAIAKKIEMGLAGLPIDFSMSRYRLYCAPDADIFFITVVSHLTGKAVMLILAERETHRVIYEAQGSVLQQPYDLHVATQGIPPMDVHVFALDVVGLQGHEVWLQVNARSELDADEHVDFSFLQIPIQKQFSTPFMKWYRDVLNKLH